MRLDVFMRLLGCFKGSRMTHRTSVETVAALE